MCQVVAKLMDPAWCQAPEILLFKTIGEPAIAAEPCGFIIQNHKPSFKIYQTIQN